MSNHSTQSDAVRDPRSTPEYSGTQHLTVAIRVAIFAWLAMAVQELLLFLRPGPYGAPYVDVWKPYFVYALFYNLQGVMTVSAPFLLFWIVRGHRPTAPRTASILHRLQLVLLTITVVLDQLDNEVMRFMGIHLTYALVRTYYRVNAWGDDMFQIIRGDRGGPGLPFVILIVVPIALWWAGERVIRSRPLHVRFLQPMALAATAVMAGVPLFVQHFRYSGWDRQLRLQPEIMTLYAEVRADLGKGTRPRDFRELARAYQAAWFRQSGDSMWRFSDPDRPLVRVPLTPGVRPAQPWNVIFIQLETFRGWNTGFLRPDVTPSATPFLDKFAAESTSAFWRRHDSFGPPTVSGFMAAHCSIKPHSRENITASYTYTALECLPSVLRRHGYRAELFTGFDPAWDNQGVWMRRWYDQYHYYDDIKNQDRAVFRRAAARIRELGRGRQPFMATVVSITNHIPFRHPEGLGPGDERFDLNPDRPPAVAIRNTMRYTDDVVRELIDSLQQEPWFARTLVIITGDHGYDLGEHGNNGESSGWRESFWVPLVIHGAHPRLPHGEHDEPATLLDIAPTVADLLGIREPTPWMGSSLVAQGHTGSPFASARMRAIFGEDGPFSMAVDPRTGRAGLYDIAHDPLEHSDISGAHPGVAAALVRQAQGEARLVNYLVEANLVWRETPTERAWQDSADHAPSIQLSRRFGPSSTRASPWRGPVFRAGTPAPSGGLQ